MRKRQGRGRLNTGAVGGMSEQTVCLLWVHRHMVVSGGHSCLAPRHLHTGSRRRRTAADVRRPESRRHAAEHKTCHMTTAFLPITALTSDG